MRHLKRQLDFVCWALKDCIDTYEETRQFVNETFSPEEYCIYTKEIETLREILSKIESNCNKWANEIIMELTIDLNEVLKMKKT